MLDPATVLPSGASVYFYRDLRDEVPVPFEISVRYQDDGIVVVDKPHFLATMPRGRHIAQTALVGGDALSFSIAAASIVAKVTRDRLMVEMDAIYPQYGFAEHKGYGTAQHLANLRHLKAARRIHRLPAG